MKRNPFAKYLGKEDVLQNQVMRYIGLKYPKTLFTHVANEGKRTPFEQYKMKYLPSLPFDSGHQRAQKSLLNECRS